MGLRGRWHKSYEKEGRWFRRKVRGPIPWPARFYDLYVERRGRVWWSIVDGVDVLPAASFAQAKADAEVAAAIVDQNREAA